MVKAFYYTVNKMHESTSTNGFVFVCLIRPIR